MPAAPSDYIFDVYTNAGRRKSDDPYRIASELSTLDAHILVRILRQQRWFAEVRRIEDGAGGCPRAHSRTGDTSG